FATRTVVHSAQAISVPRAIPLDKACLIACGVVTGVGAALNTAKIRRGSRVAIIGCGAVGLSVVQGARIAGADRIVAVDLAPQKHEWARQFGATDAGDARSGDPVEAARAAAGGPLDYAFEVVGLDRKSTRLNSSHVSISYAVFCLKKKKKKYEYRL